MAAFYKYNNEIKKAQRKSWISFTASIENVNEASEIPSKYSKYTGSLKRMDGTWTDSGLKNINP